MPDFILKKGETPCSLNCRGIRMQWRNAGWDVSALPSQVMLSRDPEYPEGYVDKLAPLPRNAGQPRIDRRKAVPPPGQEKESAAQNTS